MTFYSAIQALDIKKIKEFLAKDDFDINSKENKNAMHVLIDAYIEDHYSGKECDIKKIYEVAELLIDAKINLSEDNPGLVEKCIDFAYFLLKLLLDNGAKYKFEDSNYNVLEHAFDIYNMNNIEILLDHDPNLSMSENKFGVMTSFLNADKNELKILNKIQFV